MDIDKTLSLDAPPGRVWALLLDPVAMGACVPGMESIEVVSDTEYRAVMKVKISFISARLRLHTRIVERDEPRYLRAEGTGEDASVASSLKQVSEMWLSETEGGGTQLRIKVKVDVLGRLGTFGLGVMKTKADRLWDEFGVNASARLAGDGAGAGASAPASIPAPAMPAAEVPATAPPDGLPVSATDAVAVAAGRPGAAAPRVTAPVGATVERGGWRRLFAPRDVIRVEVRRGDTCITVSWPVGSAPECVAWLRTLT